MFFKPNEFEYKLLKDNYQNLAKERDELLKRCEIAEQTATEYQNMIERTKELQQIMNEKIEFLSNLEKEMKKYIESLKSDNELS